MPSSPRFTARQPVCTQQSSPQSHLKGPFSGRSGFSLPCSSPQSEHSAKKTFEREVLILRELLPHPNIVRLNDVLSDSAGYYLLLEFCAGGELTSRIEQYKQCYASNQEMLRSENNLRFRTTRIHSCEDDFRDPRLPP